ncbi:DUF5681 domain-containing protein [Cobetia crustatorum]|uniref:DUF5681 domain-containing protein n=1 Tax=Cobetia crustatorum TaxID=553385 RepID=A0A558HXM2_9GAMM|nr:DUF5681 domain-containing protein [Cobetia crustatorum]TVU73849.1 hypothetical protein FQP86_01925 [Cobetia crustatorum]
MSNSGQFRKGVSGNPSGRPKGAVSALRQSLQAHAPALIGKAVEMALAGDAQAIRICLDRVLPALRAEAAPLDIELPTDAGIAGTSRILIEAAAKGDIPADVAGQLVSALGQLARQTEIDEINDRIQALEGKQ